MAAVWVPVEEWHIRARVSIFRHSSRISDGHHSSSSSQKQIRPALLNLLRPIDMTVVALRFFQATVLLSASQYATAYTPPSMSKSPRWSSSSLFSAAAQEVDGTTDTAQENDHITTRDLLSLDYIRSTLIRQEETIIFALIERAQFRQNRKVYEKGGVPGLEGGMSFLDFMLSGTVSWLNLFGCNTTKYSWYEIYPQSRLPS